MSVYKEPIEWIKESVDSILHQSYRNFEFIIIIDNPNNQEIIGFLKETSLLDSRVKIFINSENLGLTKSLNKAISLSGNTEYIARMDADDIALKDRLQKQIDFLDKNKHIGVCGTGIDYFGTKVGTNIYPLSTDDVYLFIENCFAHSTVVMRRNVLVNGYYNEDFIVSQDYELWNRLYAEGVLFHNIPEVLLKYRVSSQQIMHSKGELQRKMSRINHRNALYFYCCNHDIDFTIPEGSFKISHIEKLLTLLNIPKEKQNILLYYLLLSVKDNLTNKILYIARNIRLLKYWQIIRIIYHHIRKTDIAKF